MNCSLCGHEGLEFFLRVPDHDGQTEHDLLRCTACATVHSEAVSGEDLDAAYREEYYGGGSRKFAGLIETLVRGAQARQVRGLLRLWNGGADRGVPRVLDYGCGRGVMLSAFTAAGADAVGLERPGFVVPDDLAGQVRIGDLESIADEKFDIIVLWHVLEHLDNVGDVLGALTTLLNAGGLLVIAVPNHGGWQARMFGRHWFHLDVPRHRVHLDARALVQHGERLGLGVVSESHVDPAQNAYGFLQSAMNRLFPGLRNRYYALLHEGRGIGSLEAWPWHLLAAVLAPFAVIELVLSGMVKRGATVKLVFRKRGDD